MHIVDSTKPDMDRLYHLLYKAQCSIENSKELLDNVTLFVRSLINADDEADATYSDSKSEDVNENGIQEDYDDEEEDILGDLGYDDSDSEEKEDQYGAIYFQLYLTKFHALQKKGEENQSRIFSLRLDIFCPS